MSACGATAGRAVRGIDFRERGHRIRIDDHHDRMAVLVLGADQEGAWHELDVLEACLLQILSNLLGDLAGRLRLRGLLRTDRRSCRLGSTGGSLSESGGTDSYRHDRES